MERPVNVRPTLAALAVVAALGIAGCSGSQGSDATSKPPVVGATGTVTQSTAGGGKPAAGMSGAAPMRNPNSPGLDAVSGSKSH